MHHAALQGLYLDGKKPRHKTNHRTVASALGMTEELKDLGLHVRKDHRTVAAAPGKKEEINDTSRRAEHPTLHATETPKTQ
jgi:hypothetical protein